LEQGEWVVHTGELSYFSRLADAESFGRLALVETHRRGTETAHTVCAVSDGAEWIQGFVDLHRPDAVRILDFPHALGYVAQAGHALYGEGTPAFTVWFATQRQTLKQGDPAAVVRALRRLGSLAPRQGGHHRGRHGAAECRVLGETAGDDHIWAVSSAGLAHRKWERRERQ
jgi:hypothetical protein